MMKFLPILVLLALAGLAGTGYFYMEYQKAQKEIRTIKTDPSTAQKAAQEEVKKLVSEVGQLVELPQGEEPTVATVLDAEKLKEQPFFEKSKNGDKVLIYLNAKKAILYRPDSKKIIDIGPVRDVEGEGAPAQEGQTQTPASATVAIYNGTNTAGLTNQVEASIKGDVEDIEVTRKDSTATKEYEDTVVVDVSKKFTAKAQEIAQSLGAKVGSLPSGETAPANTDILVIAGTDAQ